MINSTVLPANVVSIADVCSDSDTVRFGGTTGVQISIDENGYTLRATDARRLAVIKGKCDKALARDIGELRIGEPACSAVLPAKDFVQVFGKPAIGREQDHRVLAVLGSASSVLARCPHVDGTIQKRECPNVQGRFPDVDAVIPKTQPVATAQIDPRLLIDLLRIAEGLADDSAWRVQLEIHPPKKEGEDGGFIVLKSTNGDGQEFTAVLVQLMLRK